MNETGEFKRLNSPISKINILSSGLIIDAVNQHELVKDAFVQNDQTFHLYVSTDRKRQVSFEVV